MRSAFPGLAVDVPAGHWGRGPLAQEQRADLCEAMKALSTGFHRMAHGAQPFPVRSKDLVSRSLTTTASTKSTGWTRFSGRVRHPVSVGTLANQSTLLGSR